MTQSISSSAFLADLHRAAKRVRAEHSTATATGNIAYAIGQAAVDVLERDLRGMGDLPREVGLYWLNTSHLDECGKDDGVPDEAIDRLCAFHAFLSGGDPEDLSTDDWAELAGMVDDAAEELDIDTLTVMMSTLIGHGALD